MSKFRWFQLRQAVFTALAAVVIGILTDNPNWPWNLPMGLVVGAFVAYLVWPLACRFEAWLDSRSGGAR